MPQLIIVKRFEFACSHYLPRHSGACHRLHGHNYTLEVGITGKISKTGSTSGMIADFSQLKTLVKDNVTSHLDHQHLNDLIIEGFENPTAENMVLWMVQVLTKALIATGTELALIRLWETSGSYCEWRA